MSNTHNHSFEFLLGAVVTVVTTSGVVYVGTLLEVRHCDDFNQTGERLQFLFIQLTVPVGPYVVGEIVAININEISSIGPAGVL